jgi:predicted MFS family arabinose efflux permease
MAADPATTRDLPVRWREVFHGRRGRLTAGLLLLEALVAVQQLVIATIMPSVRLDLGMIELYGLAFTAPNLATIASIPIAGRAVDRFGARRVLVPVLALFATGLLIAATAPTMPVLIVGQFVAGAGGGGLYAMSIGTIAKTYPDRLRPRVLALLASMWILPGLVGPPLGALIASTVGWRWAFLAPYPILVVGWILIAPSLGLIPTAEAVGARISVRWPVQLMLGSGLVFVALTIVRPWSLAMLAAGVAIGVPALGHVVPRDTWRAAPGLPAAALSAFLLSVGFLAVDAFVTLMLTDVRGMSLAAASIAITSATVTWSLGSAWQSGRAERWPLGRLLALGATLVAVGEVAVASALATTVPAVVAYVGWTVVGFGMGIAFPTIPLAAMRTAAVGEEAGDLSSVLLMDVLGVATGAGLGGGILAVATALDRPVRSGLLGSFAVGVVSLLVLIALAGRLDRPRP